MYAKAHKVLSYHNGSLHIVCSYFVAPAGEEVFAVLGEDRILYIPMDSDLGKEYALRIVKKTGWNVRKIKVGKIQRSAVYTIPKSFAKTLNIKKGDQVLVIGRDNKLEIIPVRIIIEKIGPFREPNIL